MTRSILAICLCMASWAAVPADEPFNTPVRIAELEGDWQLDVPPGAYQQMLSLSPGGRGLWYQNQRTLPFSFAWFVEERELVLFYYDNPGNFQFKVAEKRLAYELSADPATQRPPRPADPGRPRRAAVIKNMLTIQDGDEKLVFRRSTLQPKFDPNLGGLQLQLSNDQAVATTAMVLDAAGKDVLLVPHLTNLATYRQGAYWEFPPGKYTVMAASQGKPVVKQTLELVAGRETPVQVYFEGNRSRVTVGEPRDKHGNHFDDETP
ncbi:MAG: hypothetical protein AB7O59_03585 [Pirellulales bacterium]